MSSRVTNPTAVTALLIAIGNGRAGAMDELMPLVYDELKTLAAAHLRRERASDSLQPTALVHEAYLRLVGQHNVSWKNRSHFFGIAAQLMRRIIVDHARRRLAAKRDGGRPVTLDENIGLSDHGRVDVVAVDEALSALAQLNERQARVVELRFFGGLTIEETAEVLDVSEMTVKRDWMVAKAWLQRELSAE